MKIILLSLLFASSTALVSADLPRYRISINGPVAVLDFSCDDPCRLDQNEIVGESGGDVTLSNTTSKNKKDADRARAEAGIRCAGGCSANNKTSQVVFHAKRTLREGIKLSIIEGKAHFIFYSVVDTEKGPATLVQQSDFWIDRPLIELDLHGHSVEVRTTMDDDERTDRFKDRNP